MSVFSPLSTQRGKEEYKLAATSDGKDKKGKKKGEKDMDDLKKEVDLVSKHTERKQTETEKKEAVALQST